MKRFAPLLLVSAALTAACGTDVTGPSSSLLACVFGEAASLTTGGVLQTRGEENQGVCLGTDSEAEFVYIPFFGHSSSGDSAATLSTELTGAGFTGAGTAGLSRVAQEAPITLGVARAAGYSVDYAFHDALRRREIEELGPLIRPGRSTDPGARSRAATTVPVVGDQRDFNVAISCTDLDIRTGEVVYVSQHAVVYADTANPADLTSGDYAFFGETFDTLVYPVETVHFGTPTDIDENGRAILFFTRAVNERNPQGSTAVTIGFFWSGDLFPEQETSRLQACPLANQSEMFYLLAPDPGGVAGVPFTLDDVRRLAIPLIGHEFQHLINASRRLFVNDALTFEDGWLNEGLSHAAEELLFLEVAGLQTGRNMGIDAIRDAGAVDAFNQYMVGNFNNYAKYLSRPDTASLRGGANSLTTRGAAWAFLRYAADRNGSGDEDFFFDLVNARTAGLENLDDVVSGSALDWMRDWTVSIYADDFVNGVADRFTASTWDWRSVYEGSSVGSYPLQVRDLVSGESYGADLPSSGAIFYRFGVAAESRATVHMEADGGVPPATLRGSFLRAR